jgi:protein phosphatase
VRGGDLIRLTKDHSLVGELVARGKLTEEQAEAHPAALGDHARARAGAQRPGRRRRLPGACRRLFLLCSDGLTSMVQEPKLKPIIQARTPSSSRPALIAARQRRRIHGATTSPSSCSGLEEIRCPRAQRRDSSTPDQATSE